MKLILFFLIFTQSWGVVRTHQELINLVGRKGEITHLYDLYARSEGVSPRERGADPTGAKDATAALQAIINEGLPIVDDGSGVYKTTSSLIVPSDTVLKIRGKLRLRPNGAFTALTHYGHRTDSTRMSADYRSGARNFRVTSTANMTVGDLVLIRSNMAWPYNPSGAVKGELSKIVRISADTLWPANPLVYYYAPSSETVTVQTYKAQVFDVEGLEIVYSPPRSAVGIAYENLDGATSRMDNITVQGAGYAGISLGQCYGLIIRDPRLIDNYETGLGYGIQINGSTDCHILGGYAYRNRHGVDFSGGHPSILCSVVGMHVVGRDDEGSCVGTHGPADRISFVGNTFTNGPIAVQIRSPNTMIHDNQYYGVVSNFVTLAGAPGISVRGNTHRLQGLPSGVAYPDAVDSWFMEVSSITTDSADFYNFANTQFVVENNSASPRTAFIRFNSGVRRLDYWSIRGNSVTIQSNGSGDSISFLEAVDSCLVKNTSVISGNVVRAVNGVYTELKNVFLRGGSDPGQILRGIGTPEAVVPARVGSIYIRTDGGASTTLYLKESGTGNTGWVGK